MFNVIQIPQVSERQPDATLWRKTCGVICIICWTYSRRGRNKAIKGPDWSQRLRATFEGTCELKDVGHSRNVLFGGTHCQGPHEKCPECKHPQADDTCWALRTDTSRHTPTSSVLPFTLKTHPIFNGSLLSPEKFNDSRRAWRISTCYWQWFICLPSVLILPLKDTGWSHGQDL